MSWTPRPATRELIENVNAILAGYAGDMTLRQVYYQLVANYAYPNTEKKYKALSGHLTNARVHGLVDGARIIDRTRQVGRPYGYDDLADFMASVRNSFQRERWQGQPEYVEVWVEKDALAGVFEPVTQRFGVRLAVCRGFPSYPAIRDAAIRYQREERAGRPLVMLYFGDHDPSGKDIPRAVEDNLAAWFGVYVEPRIVALTGEQVDEYDLPPVPAKRSDSRTAAFIAEHGDRSVELDALPPDVLQAMIREAIEEHHDATIAGRVIDLESAEQTQLAEMIDGLEGSE